MPRGIPLVSATLLLVLALNPALAKDPPTQAAQEEFFETSIRPLLASHCLECHGARKHKGGLRLDSREAILAGGDSGPAVVAGSPEQSLLIKAVHYDEELRMPPRSKLTAEQVAVLTLWVKGGAPWPETDAQV